MIYYFDTSALVKIYHAEVGCDTATQFVCADATLGDLVKDEGYQLLAP